MESMFMPGSQVADDFVDGRNSEVLMECVTAHKPGCDGNCAQCFILKALYDLAQWLTGTAPDREEFFFLNLKNFEEIEEWENFILFY